MAAVLDAFAPYVKKLIADMAQEEVSMLLGVSSEITKLEDNMEGIKAFLSDAERRRITDKSVQRWSMKLKNAMYDATDILDLCQLEADKRRESSDGGTVEHKSPGCFQPLLFCLRNPVFAHKIGSRIKELNQRLEGIHKEADTYKFNIGLGSNPEPKKLTAAELSSYWTSSQVDESAIVGEQIERDSRELIQVLTSSDNNHNIKVVSIVGVGGMGKTTLAQKIFNDATIRQHFKTKIWLSINQQFDVVDLLRTAIENAGGDHGGRQDKSTLNEALINALSTSRFLLVMDDVWSLEAWNHVLSVPVRNASKKLPGSRVLVTTRSADLPQQMQAPLHQHPVRPLENDDAWSLLNKQLRPDQVHDGTDHLKDVGIKIINKCGGLPLAIKVMGGLLSTKSRSEGDWEAVLNHHSWSVAGLPKELDNAIYLSYEDLSPQLKQCFLYCSLFPKGTRIYEGVIALMWIGEGFIHPPERGSSSYADQLEEIACGCYQDLIMRNLIEPANEITRYSCTMHDVVRSFAQFISKEESLVVQDEQDGGGSSHKHVRRLSIGSTKSTIQWDILQKHKSVRTLIINHGISVHSSDSLGCLSTLRVLFIRGVTDCDTLVDSLCQLKHLRYLHFQDSNISKLPEDIHKMKFLQHIVVNGCPKLDHLPSCITQLVYLRTLDMTSSHENVLIPKGFGQLTNLRTLFGFRVHLDMDGDGGWCSLDEIGPLSHLRKLQLQGLENVPASSSAEMAMISSKELLDYMKLNWSSSKFMGLSNEANKKQRQRVVEEVIEKLTPPCSIRHLIIEGYFGYQLPNWMMVPATCVFKSLRHLRIDNLSCCSQLPSGLCQLPCLESLAISDAPAIKIVGSEFQSPSSLPVGGGIVTAGSVVGFPVLATLRLARLCEWEEWDWEEGSKSETTEAIAMPSLKGLAIINCKLSCLPAGLANSRRLALRRLALYRLSNLTYIENFSSVVELKVFKCPKLKRIRNLSKLQKIEILYCTNVEVLEEVPSLDSMEIKDDFIETVPEYVTTVSPRYLKLTCSKRLYESLTTGSSSSEYDKINHIESRTILLH